MSPPFAGAFFVHGIQWMVATRSCAALLHLRSSVELLLDDKGEMARP